MGLGVYLYAKIRIIWGRREAQGAGNRQIVYKLYSRCLLQEVYSSDKDFNFLFKVSTISS
jgi:hypothetical protein